MCSRNAMVQVQLQFTKSPKKIWASGGDCNYDICRTICCCICAALALLWKDQAPLARRWAASAFPNRLLNIAHSFPHLSLTCNASDWSTGKVNLNGPNHCCRVTKSSIRDIRRRILTNSSKHDKSQTVSSGGFRTELPLAMEPLRSVIRPEKQSPQNKTVSAQQEQWKCRHS